MILTNVFSKKPLSKVSFWLKCWHRYYAELTCPFEKAIMGHMLELWGAHGNSVPESYYYSRNYFPDCISMKLTLDDHDDNVINVDIVFKAPTILIRLFHGSIVTREDHKKRSMEESCYHDQIDVYRDVQTGLVVYKTLMNRVHFQTLPSGQNFML